MALKAFCPECLEHTQCESIEMEREFDVRGEKITIDARYLKCRSCNEVIPYPEFEEENYERVYDIYRRRKGLLRPEEIKEIRDQYGLSQRQLAKILGWSHVTLSRYETGAIQSISHNNELVLLRDPENLMEILERNSANFSGSELKKLQGKIGRLIEENSTYKINLLIENLFTKDPDIFNGFARFYLDKLVQTVKFFAEKDHQLYKVKLMKYLWYSDFLHFKRHTVSINGLQYANLPMGPVPNNYELLLSLLQAEKDHIHQEFVDFGYENYGERFMAVGDFDSSLFNDDELRTLYDIHEKFNHHNSTSISKLSHQEKAWMETKKAKCISYEYAEALSLD